MTELEERLRAAFDARARTFESSPDAWARVQARHGRRDYRRWARPLLAAVPVALLAAFVPVLLGGGLGREIAAGPEEVYGRLMKGREPAGEQVTVDNPTEGRPMRIWFAEASLGYPEVCYVVERAAAEPYGGCAPVQEWAQADFVGSTLRSGAETAMDWGVATPEVGAVTGVTAGGRRIPGAVLAPAGAPYRIWTVDYPEREPIQKIEYADARGGHLGWSSRDMLATTPGPALGQAVELPEGVTVRPHLAEQGTTLAWTRAGAGIAESRVDGKETLYVGVTRDVIAGYAPAGVTRVAVSFPGEGTVTMEVTPDPWGLGIGLFSGASPRSDTYAGYTAIAYDASGKEVKRLQEPVREQPGGAEKPIGAVIDLPGTENSGRPTRVWFARPGDGPTVLCATGGASPYGQGSSWCAQTGPASDLPRSTATAYLPKPGVVVHFGPAGDDLEQVEAVLSDGSRVRAAFLRPEGAPGRLWHVAVPLGARVGGYLVRTRGAEPRAVPVVDKTCGRTVSAAEPGGVSLPADVTARLNGSCLAFREGGELVPALPGPVPGSRLSEQFGGRFPAYWAHGERAWYGYAPAGTAKVVITWKGGGRAEAAATPDPWGQGVALFAGQGPEGADYAETRLTGYGAGGEELWQAPR
ncbi:hypothetical protein MF672_026885 [Actinomadura sp. ATCC 31491]|uniref:Uncharacterized protein n=1 Tax=Actinomadura luzonensis TaxID=2805427 RepID=A0ABT0FYI7_9ACTN|nr:hypothetical protein [Actinomadura luzonensis]MCK2217387.1 hypothetical protein [Actinomadura luzonensis]